MTSTNSYGPVPPLSTARDAQGREGRDGPRRGMAGWLSRRTLRRLLLLLPPLAILAAASLAADWAEDRSRERSDASARERLTLYRETILRELEKYRYLPYIVARDPRAVGVLSDPAETEAANRFLKDLAATTGADALYVMDRSGLTVAASNFDTAQSFMGRNYAFRPYFQTALEGGEGRFFAVGATTGEPGFFFARSTPAGQRPQGVVVVKVDMDRLERNWQEGGETVIVTDVHGVVFLGTREDWRYASIAPLDDMVVAAIRSDRQYGGQRLRSLQEGPAHATELSIDGTDYRQSRLRVGLLDWSIHYFTPTSDVRAPRGTVWAAALAVILLYAIGLLFLRSRRLGRLTAGLREDAASLRDLNRRLVDEVDERRRVERELRATQADLARASRLAAVGQMSAAVAHELNQPLAALGMFVSGARLYQQRGEAGAVLENLDEIDALRLRMANLTQDLKRFARPGESRIETVDLRDCLKTSAKLVRPRVEETGVALQLHLSTAALVADTAPLRVEQVLVNLIRNAIDACLAASEPRVEARAWSEDGKALIEVSDNGTGIPEGLRERIFEPFFTTKPAASGLGLGLAISARIVEDLGGSLTLREARGGGACFVLCLPLAPSPDREAPQAREELAGA